MQTTAIGTVANSLLQNEVIILTLLISTRYIPYTDLHKNPVRCFGVSGYGLASREYQSPQLAHPQYGRRGGDDDTPIGRFEGYDAEHRAAEGDDQVLPDEYEQGDEDETVAVCHVECRASGAEGAGVEEVPELQHHEEREEEAQLVGRYVSR